MTPEKTFDEATYKAYSPLYLPVTFALSYGLNFLGVSRYGNWMLPHGTYPDFQIDFSTVTHAIIHFWKPVKLHFKRSLREQPDIHAQLMSRYPQGM